MVVQPVGPKRLDDSVIEEIVWVRNDCIESLAIGEFTGRKHVAKLTYQEIGGQAYIEAWNEDGVLMTRHNIRDIDTVKYAQ